MHLLQKSRGSNNHLEKEPLFLTLFSPSLVISVLCWGLGFYLTEPALWNNLSQGLHNIQKYLEVASTYGVPSKPTESHIRFILYAFKRIPENFMILIRSANPLFFFLSIIGVIFSAKKFPQKALKIALLPAIFFIILLFTKPFLAEEYLLHPLPFLYIFSSLGLYALYLFFSTKKLKIIYHIFLVTLVIYSLYITLWEIRYFSLGNIRYFAQTWAGTNLKGQCVSATPGTINSPLSYHHNEYCPIHAATDLEYEFKPNYIVLKTFQLEGPRPLLHHLREYKIFIYTKKGKLFTEKPLIPTCPIPHLPAKKSHFVRFMNGINFDPSYNKFLLLPHTTYDWLLVSKPIIKSLNFNMINSNIYNTIKIGKNKTIRMLPFEKKDVRVLIHPLFPWCSPYLYRLKIQNGYGVTLLNLAFGKKNHMPLKTLKIKNINPGEISFSKYFIEKYHYDFRYLRPFLSVRIPTKTQTNFNHIDPTVRKLIKNNSCFLNIHPIFLEKGFYKFEGIINACFNDKMNSSYISFYVLSPPQILAKARFSKRDFTDLKIPFRPATYKFVIPFEIKKSAMVVFCATHPNNVSERILNLTLKADFRKIEKVKYERGIILDFLSNSSSIPPKLLQKIDVKVVNSHDAFLIGKVFLKKHNYKMAKKWLNTACNKNPLNINYLESLLNVLTATRDIKKAAQIREKLQSLKGYCFEKWEFQTGLSLNAYKIPSSAQRGDKISVSLLLTLPHISGDQTLFISCLKKGNLYFGKDFSLYDARKYGELYMLNGTISIPKKMPRGVYKIYLTFRIPKINYFYKLIEPKNQTNNHMVLLKEITIM